MHRIVLVSVAVSSFACGPGGAQVGAPTAPGDTSNAAGFDGVRQLPNRLFTLDAEEESGCSVPTHEASSTIDRDARGATLDAVFRMTVDPLLVQAATGGSQLQPFAHYPTDSFDDSGRRIWKEITLAAAAPATLTLQCPEGQLDSLNEYQAVLGAQAFAPGPLQQFGVAFGVRLTEPDGSLAEGWLQAPGANFPTHVKVPGTTSAELFLSPPSNLASANAVISVQVDPRLTVTDVVAHVPFRDSSGDIFSVDIPVTDGSGQGGSSGQFEGAFNMDTSGPGLQLVLDAGIQLDAHTRDGQTLELPKASLTVVPPGP